MVHSVLVGGPLVAEAVLALAAMGRRAPPVCRVAGRPAPPVHEGFEVGQGCGVVGVLAVGARLFPGPLPVPAPELRTAAGGQGAAVAACPAVHGPGREATCCCCAAVAGPGAVRGVPVRKAAWLEPGAGALPPPPGGAVLLGPGPSVLLRAPVGALPEAGAPPAGAGQVPAAVLGAPVPGAQEEVVGRQVGPVPEGEVLRPRDPYCS